MPNVISILALAIHGLFPANLPDILDNLSLPPQTRQVLVVCSNGWGESTGQMQRFVRETDGWQPSGAEHAVVVGTKGMRWGRGLHQAVTTAPQKVEGDSCAPAGIFHLGHAFGYGPTPPTGTRWSYRMSTPQDFFVDDAKSAEYNQWVRLSRSENPAGRWNSFERMRRSDGLYEFGVVVNHNTSAVSPGKGSAIFLHVWRAAGRGTAGCTAMPREQMADLIKWLDPAKQPLLIQVPKDQLGVLRLN